MFLKVIRPRTYIDYYLILQDIQPDITVPLPGFSTKKVSKKPHAFKIWHYSGKMKTYLLQFDDDDSMKKCTYV